MNKRNGRTSNQASGQGNGQLPNLYKDFLHISAIFWNISAILEDFLTGKGKKYKLKKLRLVDTYLECGLRFFIFSQKGLQNGR
ncbi:MAG: hypothetical protein GY782_08725 [Gammaproteobacteria bacterium]|nr:hypothetical protein [Gammaproteobacteria bacterium]